MAKAAYYSEQLEAAKFNMKETWTLLKSAMNKSTTQNALPEYFIIDNNNVQDKNDIQFSPGYRHPYIPPPRLTILARILATLYPQLTITIRIS